MAERTDGKAKILITALLSAAAVAAALLVPRPAVPVAERPQPALAGAVFSAWVNARDYGAIGNGTHDDTAGLQAALDAAGGMPTGCTVFIPRGTYKATNANPGILSYALTVPSNVTVKGEGRGLTVIKLAASQDKFTHVLHVDSRTNVTIRDLTVNGNQAAQAGGNDAEQQHGIFVNGGSDVAVLDCELRDTAGDCVYWYNNAVRPSAIGCRFQGSRRTSIHAQTLTDGLILNCHFWGNLGANHVKSELDGEGQQGNGLVVSGCSFTGSGGSDTTYGVQMGGLSEATAWRNVTVTGCTFRKLACAVSLGIFSHGWAVSGNAIDDCKFGVAVASDNTAYGFGGHKGVVISGNALRNMRGDWTDSAGVWLANCDSFQVVNNTIEGTGASGELTLAMLVSQSRNGRIAGNVITKAASNSLHQGLQLYRCQYVGVADNLVSFPAGGLGYAFVVSDDGTYPSKGVWLRNNQVSGEPGAAIRLQDYSATNGELVTLGRLLAPNATSATSGATDRTQSDANP